MYFNIMVFIHMTVSLNPLCILSPELGGKKTLKEQSTDWAQVSIGLGIYPKAQTLP